MCKAYARLRARQRLVRNVALRFSSRGSLGIYGCELPAVPGRRALRLKQKDLMMLCPIWTLNGFSLGGASDEKEKLLRTLGGEVMRLGGVERLCCVTEMIAWSLVLHHPTF